MSSYATAYLSDGRPVCTFRNGVDPLFFTLFTPKDRVELRGPEAYRLVSHTYNDLDEPDAEVIGYRISAGALRDRMDVMGVSAKAVASELDTLRAQEIERLSDPRWAIPDVPALAEERDEKLALLRVLDWSEWKRRLRDGIESGLEVRKWGAREELGSPSWLLSIWDDYDERFPLRAVLEVLPPNETLTLDLSDLIHGGWIDEDSDPDSEAKSFLDYATDGAFPPIILTEGRFDVEVLDAAVRLRRPHLRGYLRFPDFTSKPEGGAAALRQTVRAFAAAGIPNRVIALFDNDAAARDVLRSVDPQVLPPNILVTRLPELSFASSYPTIGPQGHHAMDENGLATSIELFLGTDVLMADNALRPVLWRGYVPAIDAYQGEVADKDAIQAAFRTKVAIADADTDAMADQDWEALDALLEHLIELIREVT